MARPGKSQGMWVCIIKTKENEKTQREAERERENNDSPLTGICTDQPKSTSAASSFALDKQN